MIMRMSMFFYFAQDNQFPVMLMIRIIFMEILMKNDKKHGGFYQAQDNDKEN